MSNEKVGKAKRKRITDARIASSNKSKLPDRGPDGKDKKEEKPKLLGESPTEINDETTI